MNDPESALDLLLADPMREARAGSGAIGHVGADVPVDLLHASGRPFLHLPWSAGRPTPFADGCLESSFPGWARSMLEDWAGGAFDALEAVVFSRGDDVSQRLYYYVRELQRRGRLRGPEALVYDVARIPRAASLRHTAEAIRLLAHRFGADDEALRRGIARADALRERCRALQATRAGRGVLHHKLARASLFADVGPLLDAVGREAGGTAHRVLLVGSSPPDERLHAAVAAGGGEVVAETHAYALRRLGPPIGMAAADDPALAIARQRHASGEGPRGFGDPARLLEEAVREARADAVVLWLTAQDEALAWHVPAQCARVRELGLPLLALTARRWTADDGALEEIRGFVERLS